MKTLTDLFDVRSVELQEALDGISMPGDASELKNQTKEFLYKLISEGNEYRSTLTIAEDALLQMAYSLIEIALEIHPAISSVDRPLTPPAPESMKTPSNSLAPVIGTVIGGVVGTFFGPWATVGGAVAGSVVATRYQGGSAPKTVVPEKQSEENRIDPTPFVAGARQLCVLLDRMVMQHRNHTQNLISNYENREKVTLGRSFPLLLETVQSVLGLRSMDPADESGRMRIAERCTDLAESLENYGLQAVDYSESADGCFTRMESKHVSVPTTKKPAILDGDTLILKGTVLVPPTK